MLIFIIGEEAFESAKARFTLILAGMRKNSAFICGHSLGGNLAQWITALCPHKIGLLVTSNSPGVSQKVHDHFKWNNRKNTYQLPIVIIRTEKDPVHWVGGYHLGYQKDLHHLNVKIRLVYYILENYMITNAHTYLCMANPCNIALKKMTYMKQVDHDIL